MELTLQRDSTTSPVDGLDVPREDMGLEHSDANFVLAGLTAKQRQVLDLLIEHKTSKEIARQLGISPHTVDQRIQFAKEKLGAASRNEAAAAYRNLVALSGRVTYEESRIARAVRVAEEAAGTQAGPLLALTRPGWTHPNRPIVPETDYRVVPELFEGRHGTLMRLGAIIVIAVFLVVLVLGGLAILSELSDMLAG